MVEHIERFNPAVTKLIELLQNKKMGKIVLACLRRVTGRPPCASKMKG